MIKDSTLRFLEPGMYAGSDGSLNIDAAEYLIAHGYEPNPKNQEVICRAFRSQAACPVKVIDHYEKGES